MDAKIQELVDLYKELEKDGWEFEELVKFCSECILILIPQAQDFMDMAGSDKKQWVLDTIRTTYFMINPNIRGVPEPFETMLEKFTIDIVLSKIVSPLIDTVVSFMKDKGLL